MIYQGLTYNYPFPIPDSFICYTVNELARQLGTTVQEVKDWEAAGSIPTRSRSGIDHDSFWTPDEMKEAYIKGTIIMRRS